MANWDNIEASGNVEDRRRSNGMMLGGGVGLAGIAVFLALNFLGIQLDPALVNTIIGSIESSQSTTPSAEFEGQDSYETFAKQVLGSSNTYWTKAFVDSGRTYTEPKLVLYRSMTPTACGTGSSQSGPFYCPTDQTIYLDETFFDVIQQLGGSNGDVAQAYVIAHEAGHHAQNLLGTMDNVMNNPEYRRSGQNSLSVKLELQADCYAGLWANSLKNRDVFGPGEINQAIETAAAVGDDRIQASTQGSINPETWTHGSSKDRVAAFSRGYDSGQLQTCSL